MKKYLLVLYLIIFIACDNYEEDKQKCDAAGADKQKCLSVNSTSSEYYCCYDYSKANENENECKILDQKTYFKYFTTKANAFEKEKIGFECYNSLGDGGSTCETKKESHANKVRECTSGIPIEEDKFYTFEQSEIEILGNEKHCLAYQYKLVEASNLTETTKEDCSKALITQKAKNEGLTCAFYEFIYTSENSNEKMKINTCYLLNPDSINIEDKAIIDISQFASALIGALNVPNVELNQVSISDDSGHSFSYDEKEGKIKDNSIHADSSNTTGDTSNTTGDSSNTTNSTTDDNSKIISFSKLLLLLILISL